MEKEPRYKLFRIDPDQVLAMLNWNQYKKVSLPINKGIPPDAEVETINHDYSWRCLVARVYHKSFDIVPDGGCIPIADEWLEVEERVIDIEAYQEACNRKDKSKILSSGDNIIGEYPVVNESYIVHYSKGLDQSVDPNRHDSIHLGFKHLRD
jgi:hypothetical protein